MMRRLLVLALLLVSALAHAGEKAYSLNAQAVTDTGISVTFVDNHSGGSGLQMVAQEVFVKNDGTSNEVYCDVLDRTATTADKMIPFGEGYTFGTSPTNENGGYLGIGCICASGESTTVRIWAQGR